MRRLLSSGLVVFAGMVSVPLCSSSPCEERTSRGLQGRSPIRSCSSRSFQKTDCPARHMPKRSSKRPTGTSSTGACCRASPIIESTGGKAAKNNNLFGWDSGQRSSPPRPPASTRSATGWPTPVLYKDKDLDDVC